VKYRLIHLSGSLVGRVRDIDADEIVLGRDPRLAQIVFGPGDRAVSRRHVLLRAEAGTLLLRDLESTGGTFLNGIAVSQTRLAPGDVIQLGMDGPKVRYELQEAFQQTPLPDPAPEAATDPSVGRRLRLTFLSGARVREVLELSGSVLRMGRAAGSQVWTPDDKVTSAQHARIVRMDDGYVLIDLESRNGTYLNGHRVQRARLASGDVIGLGSTGPELRTEVLGQEVGGDTVEIPGFATLVTRPRPAVKVRQLVVPETGLSVGRASDCGLRLDSPIVSLVHARLERGVDGTIEIEDTDSTNGTYVRDARISSPAALTPGVTAIVGPFHVRALKVPFTVEVLDTRNRARLDAREVSVRQAGRTVVDRVSLSLVPGSLTALVGPRASGKSTLLEALAGLRPLHAGRVEVDGLDLHARLAQLPRLIGYVPQDDVVHTSLTVGRALQHAARLRLPPAMGAADRERRVTDLLALLELTEHQDEVVADLSAAQRKRVSIAAELLTDPPFLLLDDPTSGLDPGPEESLMLLLKELTHKGRTIVLVTQTLTHAHLCDSLALLSEGRLVSFGSPADTRRQFAVDTLANLYPRLRERSADGWRANFEASEGFKERVEEPLKSKPDGSFVKATPMPDGAGSLRQLVVLARRHAETLTRDRRHLTLLVLHAPVLAALCGLSLLRGSEPSLPALLVLAAAAAGWFGVVDGARELVDERAVHLRERRLGLHVLPDVLSKVVVLAGLVGVQCAAFLLVLGPWMRPPGPWPALLWPLLAAGLTGVLIGLAVSALARSRHAALAIVAALQVPQLLFAVPAALGGAAGPSGLLAAGTPLYRTFRLLRHVAMGGDPRPDLAVLAAMGTMALVVAVAVQWNRGRG
jgi:ABC-type multidrug transport system ATPase subunit/pSer/pThr/pTyr-binding forkhead associated (FHA) protein